MDFYHLKSILRYDHPQKCSKINEILRASSPHGYQALVFYGSGLISRSFTLIRAVEKSGFFFIFIFSPLFLDSPTPKPLPYDFSIIFLAFQTSFGVLKKKFSICSTLTYTKIPISTEIHRFQISPLNLGPIVSPSHFDLQHTARKLA